jgi:hypothetical protein
MMNAQQGANLLETGSKAEANLAKSQEKKK